jgi:RNA polymerase sigma factor (sigma-70 family)
MSMSTCRSTGTGTAFRVTDHAFIQALFVNYSETLRGYIRRRVKNEADVSELVQEVYLSLLRRRTAASLQEAPESYLFRTAINLIRDQHRRNSVRCADRHIPLCEEIAGTDHHDPEALLVSEQTSSALTQAVAELAPKTRRVFLMRRIQELSYREIESRTSIPLRSIERYVNQAVAYCSGRIERQI